MMQVTPVMQVTPCYGSVVVWEKSIVSRSRLGIIINNSKKIKPLFESIAKN